MLLSEEEFLHIKDRFIKEVIDKLRELAGREAELLVRLYRHHPQMSPPVMSTRLSRVMLRAADAIEAAIDALTEEDYELVKRLVVDHLPPVLIEAAGDRLWQRTPRSYLKWIMAKSLAARIVYREGFEYLEAMPMTGVADLALRYLRLELERTALAEEVERSGLPRRERIAAVLRKAGILSTLDPD